MDEFMGIIKLFAGSFEPKDFFKCDGRVLPIAQYQALFSLLGTTYGGDGSRTFNLPKIDLPIEGCMYIICYQGIYPSRP